MEIRRIRKNNLVQTLAAADLLVRKSMIPLIAQEDGVSQGWTRAVKTTAGLKTGS